MPKPNQQVQDSPDFSKRLRKLLKKVDFNAVKAASASGFTESTVPDGRYQFIPMSRSGIKPAKNDRLYDTWQFLIVDGGEQDAQVLYKTLWFEGEDDTKTQNSLAQIVKMLAACGYEIDDDGENISECLDDLMETKPLLTGQVRWNSYTDRTGTARRQQNVYINSADFEDTWADQDLFAYGQDEKKSKPAAVTAKTKKAATVSSEEEEEEDEETPVKRGRGRPKGSTNKSTAAAPAPTVKAKKKAAPAPVADDDEEEDEEEETPAPAPKRGRGRPPKNPATTTAVAAPAEDEDEEEEDAEEETAEDEEEAEEDLDINDVIRFKNKAGQTVEGPIESFDESDPDNTKAVVKKDGKIYRVTFDQLEKVS